MKRGESVKVGELTLNEIKDMCLSSNCNECNLYDVCRLLEIRLDDTLRTLEILGGYEVEL